jgi:citrate lyase subunit beta / citryl-CoA lyase
MASASFARSYLYMAGDRPEFLAEAPGRGTDALILDLEDGAAVPLQLL